MANFCNNEVQFIADASILQQINQLITQMAEKEIQTDEGQLPEFFNEQEGYMFSIRMEGDLVFYETRWSPNIAVIKSIADHFKTGFRYIYYELGRLLYGEYNYSNEILDHAQLDTADFDLFEEIEGEALWKFEEDTYESEFDILEILLERKVGVVITV